MRQSASMYQTAVLFSLRRESAPFRRRLKTLDKISGSPNPAWQATIQDRNILVLETGIGPGAASRATTWLLDNYPVNRVIAAGFSGALDPKLAVGDVVYATDVVEPDGRSWPLKVPIDSPLQGRLLTVPRLVASGAEKRALNEHHQATMVDMESAAIAAVCHSHSVPVAAIRAISDTADMELSLQLASLLNGGRVHPLRLLRAVARQPSLIAELTRLARDTRQAAGALAAALHALIADGFRNTP